MQYIGLYTWYYTAEYTWLHLSNYGQTRVKYISYTMVQSFNQDDPTVLLVLFENLHIYGHFSIITVPIFHYIDNKLPFFSDFEQKSRKIIIL